MSEFIAATDYQERIARGAQPGQLPPNPSTGHPSTLSGQQIQALAQSHAAALAGIKRDIELRKWAIDQACGLAGALAEAEAQKILDPVALARDLHKFIVEGVGSQERLGAEKAEER